MCLVSPYLPQYHISHVAAVALLIISVKPKLLPLIIMVIRIVVELSQYQLSIGPVTPDIDKYPCKKALSASIGNVALNGYFVDNAENNPDTATPLPAVLVGFMYFTIRGSETVPVPSMVSSLATVLRNVPEGPRDWESLEPDNLLTEINVQFPAAYLTIISPIYTYSANAFEKLPRFTLVVDTA